MFAGTAAAVVRLVGRKMETILASHSGHVGWVFQAVRTWSTRLVDAPRNE
jgi:hypothetical protein